MGFVYIDGVAQTKFGKDPRNLEEILAEAAQRALDNSECKEPPDGIVIGNYNYLGYTGQKSLDTLDASVLGIKQTTPIYHVNRGSATGAAAVELGFELAQQGKKVLVVSGEKMLTEEPDRERITEVTSKVIHEKERAHGITMPIIAAIATTEYMLRYGKSEDQIRKIFFQILNQNRNNGSENPFAYFQGEVPREVYFDLKRNPFVAAPLTRYDCAGTYNGAAAVFLVPGINNIETDIKLSGIRSASTTEKINGRRTLTSLDATVNAARELFQDTNLNPHEIDIFELHDAFAPVPIIAAEDLALVERGQGSDFILHEKNRYGRRVFYNRSGGFFSKTHPIAASGTAQLVELTKQMRCVKPYDKMFKDDEHINYGSLFSMSAFGTECVLGIVEKTEPSIEREGLNINDLPQYFTPRDTPIDIVERYRRRKIVGTTELPSDDKTQHHIGVVTSTKGKLHLVHYTGYPIELGERVKISKGKHTLYAIPVSHPVGSILQKYLGRIPGILKR